VYRYLIIQSIDNDIGGLLNLFDVDQFLQIL
jgi:hypothetical protein